MQHKVRVSVQYLEAIRMEAGGDQDDDIDLCCQSPKGTLRTDCGKEVPDPQYGCRLWPLRSPYVQKPWFLFRFHFRHNSAVLEDVSRHFVSTSESPPVTIIFVRTLRRRVGPEMPTIILGGFGLQACICNELFYVATIQSPPPERRCIYAPLQHIK
jgi:hypothetical protein